MKLSILLPAYNEEHTLPLVLDALVAADLSSLPTPVEKEIIVVDDASTDRTADAAAGRDGVLLLRHDRNRGKAAAIRTALARATGDVVIIQDADMEYSVADYPALLRPFIESDARVVYGSRFLKRPWPTRMRPANFIANKILTAAANLLFRCRLTDEATCLKLFRADLLKSLPLAAEGFNFCPEATALVRLRGARIVEVPIEYQARGMKEGKKVRWTDGLRALWTLARRRMRGRHAAGA